MIESDRPQFSQKFFRGQHTDSRASLEKPEALKRLEVALGQIYDSETFRHYLDVQARFHKYSWGNVLLILMQRPEATRVAGYNAWLRMHRFVKKGEPGIRIIVPMRRKNQSDDPDEQPGVFFGTGVVFDVSQTDGEPLPEMAVPVLEGDEGAELYGEMEELAARNGVSIRIGADEELGRALGSYDPRAHAVVLKEAPMMQMTKTLAHELAHHFGAIAGTDAENESVAESVAYVVCGHFGLDTGARSFPYIASWSKEATVFKRVLTVIQQVAATMIEAIEENMPR